MNNLTASMLIILCYILLLLGINDLFTVKYQGVGVIVIVLNCYSLINIIDYLINE